MLHLCLLLPVNIDAHILRGNHVNRCDSKGCIHCHQGGDGYGRDQPLKGNVGKGNDEEQPCVNLDLHVIVSVGLSLWIFRLLVVCCRWWNDVFFPVNFNNHISNRNVTLILNVHSFLRSTTSFSNPSKQSRFAFNDSFFFRACEMEWLVTWVESKVCFVEASDISACLSFDDWVTDAFDNCDSVVHTVWTIRMSLWVLFILLLCFPPLGWGSSPILPFRFVLRLFFVFHDGYGRKRAWGFYRLIFRMGLNECSFARGICWRIFNARDFAALFSSISSMSSRKWRISPTTQVGSST